MPFVSINGKSIYYTRQSPQSYSLSILMIHGLGSSSSFYAPIIPDLCAAGFDCVAFDTCGSGLSKYSDQDQSVNTIAEDVVALMSQLSLSPAKTILVGHSMGGIVACQLASQSRYAGIALLGPVHPVPGLADIFSSRIKRVQESGMECMADEIPKAATGTKAQPVHRAFIRALLLAQSVEGYSSLCSVIATAQPPNYADIDTPVLLLAGSDDKTSPLKNVTEIYNGCDTAEESKVLKVLEGVGHWHVIEAADAVRTHLIEFIRTKIASN